MFQSKEKTLFQLTDLEVNEISLVDRAANEDAKVILFKRETAVDRATAALKALRGAIAGNGGASLPKTVAGCDKAIQAIAVGHGGDYSKALATPAGKAIYAARQRLARGLANPVHSRSAK